MVLNKKIIIIVVSIIVLILMINIILFGGNIIGFVVVSNENQEIEYLKTTIYYTEFVKIVDSPLLEEIQLCSKDNEEIVCNKLKSKIDKDEWDDGYYWYVKFSGLNKNLEKIYLELYVRSFDNKVMYFFYRDYFVGE